MEPSNLPHTNHVISILGMYGLDKTIYELTRETEESLNAYAGCRYSYRQLRQSLSGAEGNAAYELLSSSIYPGDQRIKLICKGNGCYQIRYTTDNPTPLVATSPNLEFLLIPLHLNIDRARKLMRKIAQFLCVDGYEKAGYNYVIKAQGYKVELFAGDDSCRLLFQRNDCKQLSTNQDRLLGSTIQNLLWLDALTDSERQLCLETI